MTDQTASATPSVGAPLAGGSAAGSPAPAAVVRDYGDPVAEYGALRNGALLVDRSQRDRWVLRGAKARDTLTGLVTNDIAGLLPGQGCYAAALSPKGRIVADVRVFAVAEEGGASGDGVAGPFDGAALLVDVPPRAAEGFGAILRKYVNPRATPYARLGEAVRGFGVYGLRARDAVAAAFAAAPAALAALPAYAHATVALDGVPLLLLRVPELGVEGFEVVGPAAAVDAAWARVAAAVPGVVAGGEAAYTIARIEAGYPEWGIDIDESTIPQEANFDELKAISYTKGCYTGQEVVARVHFRGHVNRHLRGVASLADGAGPVPAGAQLVDQDGKAVGDVRSSAVSPRLGGVAIGMVRREVPLGTALVARWSAPIDGEAEAPLVERGVTIGTLPFPL